MGRSRSYRRRLLAVAVAGLIAAAGPAAEAGALAGVAPPARLPALSVLGHQGRWVTDAQGRVVIVHGFNVVVKRAPYEPAGTGFGADDAAFLAAHGFTAVRLGVLLEGLEPQPGVYDASYLASIASTVRLLAGYGIRSLLDFHQDLYNQRFQGEGLPAWMVLDDGLPAEPQAGFPGDYFVMPGLNRAFDNFWANAAGPGGVGLQDRYAAAWAHLATAFRGDPAVLGYDLFNEPWPGSVWPGCFPPAGCPVFDRTVLAPFSAKVIAAIHKVDPTHLAFYEPALPFDYSAPTYLGKVGDARSGFGFHAYCLAAVGAPETPPTRSLCNQVESSTVGNALSQAGTSGDALLLTEFGATTDVAELDEVVGLADAHSVPWLEWAYCACGDPTGAGSAEALVYDPQKPPIGANVDQTTLRALDEPYPQAVAGTPLGYHFDPVSATFTLRYVAGRPGGGRYPPGTTTTVYVPALQYPHGYRTRVSGARVVSAPGASSLALTIEPGAAVVTLTITPGGTRAATGSGSGAHAPGSDAGAVAGGATLAATGAPSGLAWAGLVVGVAGLLLRRRRRRVGSR
ncbi:MAG TPA: cellulase family glycosylhydrolase [Mycobacteriales bacterium]|nr:cellulase family glycosylhydrolase [Mycobacteriales bacterium]